MAENPKQPRPRPGLWRQWDAIWELIRAGWTWPRTFAVLGAAILGIWGLVELLNRL